VADVEVETRREHAVRGAHRLDAVDRGDDSDRKHAGAGGQEANRDRPLEARRHERIGNGFAERLGDRDVVQIDAGPEPDEIRHLSGGDARRDLDDAHAAVAPDEQLREGDAVTEAQRADRLECD
jgi:hypothetical protein